MERSDLISYAVNFVSFLIKKSPKISKVILFGSVARGDFDDKSDIDLFVDTESGKKDIEILLELYEKSEESRKYRLEGIKNDIMLKVGKLDKWGSLKLSIASDGILLYGKYEESPKGIKNYLLFKISAGKMERKNKIKIWRKVYGYRQKIGKKVYYSKGLVEGGKKLGFGLFFMPSDKSREMIDFLRKNKVDYEIKEILF
ncbi:MAG: nucleotidyltransferase domain-containing protein [Nanoarchaeota archaeon]|nr:nucleotidyltransferase domain-containing protein [Nanoarchaeota archaeon]MBU1005672.1 nucleotidyltransferase domain-containing protein [Nanoarchaeota archaeon]MBU1946903.1 nucleotidyltransferase domain-containing protein [Nanoarchaeota archaeon]